MHTTIRRLKPAALWEKSAIGPIPDQISLDPWKLSLCPRCDYSLEGLPDTGACPECGEQYSQDFIVLRGQPIFHDDQPNGLRIASPLGISVALAIFVLIAGAARTANAGMIAVFLLIALATIFQFVLWFSQARRNKALIWMGRQGIAQQALLDRGSLGARLQTTVLVFGRVIFPPLLLFLIVVAIRSHMVPQSHDPFPVSTLLCGLMFAVPALLLCGLVYIGQLRRITCRGQGIRPGLLRWTAYRSIEIRPLGDREYQLKTIPFYTTRSREVIHVEFTATAEAIKQLCALISTWSEHRRVPVMKPMPDVLINKAARSAGLAVRKVFMRD